MSKYDLKLLNAAFEMRSQGAFRLDVQGLRAVAVLAVLIFHANSAWLKAGFVGVDVFFVISGFIITKLLTDSNGKVDLLAFYCGRIRRILPAYLVMLAIVIVVAAVLFLPADFGLFYKSFKASAAFTSNSYFADYGGYFAPLVEELPLLHTWSLAIEMQFYLIFPLLVCVLPKRWLAPVCVLLAVGLFVWSGYQSFTNKQDKLYFSLLARAPEFLVGALVALLLKERDLPPRLSGILGVCGTLLLIFSFTAIDKQGFPGLWFIIPCVGAAFVIAARQGPVSRVLASRPMVWIGGISYSLYLWHWPVLAFIRYYTGQYELATIWLLVFLIWAFLLAWLSFRFVEIPMRTARGLRRQLPKWAVVAVCFSGLVVLSGHLNGGLVVSLPSEMTRYAAPEQICHGAQVGDCKRGSADAVPSVLVIGDSHAAQLNYFFDEVGNELQTAYRVLTASSCVPIPGFDVERLPADAQNACTMQMEAVVAQLLSARKVIIAGMWQYQMKSPAFVKAFELFLKQSAQEGRRVVVLAQVPMFQSNVMRVRRFNELGLPVSLSLNTEWIAANSQVEAIVNRLDGVQFLDFSGSSFFADAPFWQGALIYSDSHHLNERGAHQYGRYAAVRLQHLFDNR